MNILNRKICLNASFYLKQKTGIGFYILTLCKALDILKENYTIEELNLPQNMKFKPFFDSLWQNTGIYIKTLINRPNYMICPSFYTPFIRNKSTMYITVIYDLCCYRTQDVSKKWADFFQNAIKKTIIRTDLIVTDSNTIKNELIKRFNIKEDKIKVLYGSIGEHFVNAKDNPEIIRKYHINKNKYILSVATLHKNKNIPELIRAFERISPKYPDLKLVLVGGMGNELREKLTKHPNIIFTGYIPDEDIPVLYKNALLYMYPSLYEGFGIPLIEAQYCNCPVLCSDIPVFREVGGDGAEFCESDVNNIAEKMEFLINNPEKLKELKIKGLENVKRFSIEKIAQQLKEILQYVETI